MGILYLADTDTYTIWCVHKHQARTRAQNLEWKRAIRLVARHCINEPTLLSVSGRSRGRKIAHKLVPSLLLLNSSPRCRGEEHGAYEGTMLSEIDADVGQHLAVWMRFAMKNGRRRRVAKGMGEIVQIELAEDAGAHADAFAIGFFVRLLVLHRTHFLKPHVWAH